MARIISIDFGTKRCGIAVSDPLQIIATGLAVVPAQTLIAFLKQYFQSNEVELIIIGLPTNLDGSPTHATAPAQKMFENLCKAFPKISVKQVDERFSSKIASQELLKMGMKKSDRKKKENIDIIAATMILQEYLEGDGKQRP